MHSSTRKGLKDARSLSRSTDFVLDEQEKSDVSVRKPAVQFKGERGFIREKDLGANRDSLSLGEDALFQFLAKYNYSEIR